MLSLEQIEQLEAFDGRGARVLSVYLDLDPGRHIRYAYRIVFKDLVKEARERLDEATREALSCEAARVREWLESEEPRGKGLALFSCSPRGLWQAHFLPVRVKDHLAYEPRPYVAPLLDVLDEYERYAVALVDKKKARLFTVFMGEIEERQKLEDFVPGHHDQGGLSQPNCQRHHEAHVYWHLERVAQRLTELYRERPFDRLILAGPEEPTTELRRLLPRALAQRLVATLPAETFASDAEILHRTLEIEQRAERETEKRLLDELLETAGGGGRATVGLDPTLDALWRDQVQILVVADGLRTSGGECPSCYRLVRAGVATCPVCGTAPRPIDDLVERAVERTLDQNGRVEVVHGEAARRLQEAGGGIGALLRFV